MKKHLFQLNFVIKDLLPSQVKLKRKLWLKDGKLLLEKKGDKLHAYLLEENGEPFNGARTIIPYLWVSSLVSNNAPHLEGGGGVSIDSKDALGTKPIYSVSVSKTLPEDAVSHIEEHAHKFLRFIGILHDKYIAVISKYEFIEIALDYFSEAEKKFVYSNEGFISAIISMEALFNEGPSDIKYKLSHRAAFLLGLWGIDPIKAFEKLKSFYNTRSTLVHGGGSLPHDPDRHLVSHYTRISIIIFLILLKNEERQSIGKKKIKSSVLQEIDYAMLDESKAKSLRREIKRGCKDFKLPVPRIFEDDQRTYRVTAW